MISRSVINSFGGFLIGKETMHSGSSFYGAVCGAKTRAYGDE